MRSKSHLILISFLVLWAVNASSAFARPPHKKALADYFGPFFAKKLNDCRTCHLPDKPLAWLTTVARNLILNHVRRREGIPLDDMTPADWESVRVIYRQGIATGQATFEAEPPSWAASPRSEADGTSRASRASAASRVRNGCVMWALGANGRLGIVRPGAWA